jgi:hypothetical protein
MSDFLKVMTALIVVVRGSGDVSAVSQIWYIGM